MNRIYIRVDGNEIIATGHVMRCLSIAEQIRLLGAEVTFIVADDRSLPLIEDRGFSAEILDTVWNDLDGETDIICAYVKQHNVKVLLVDSYYVTEEYLYRLSEYVSVVYLDDLYRFPYPVHTVINYAAFVNDALYIDLYKAAAHTPCLLLGSHYIPLREEFAGGSFEVNPKIRRVLITTGGADRLNVAGTLLRAISDDFALNQLEYHVIVGCFNENRDMLKELAAQSQEHIYLHENVRIMSEWMRKCDAAVSAAGTTIYELCACGTPTVCLEIADNQEGASIWEHRNYMRYAGNASLDLDACIQKCMEALLWYDEHPETRAELSARMQKLVDGKGAGRIAEYLCGLHAGDDL